MALHTGEFLRTRANPMLDMLLQSQVAQRMRTNPMAAYNMRGLSFYRVSGLTDTVLAVERGCAVAGRDAADACGALKRRWSSICCSPTTNPRTGPSCSSWRKTARSSARD